MSASTPTGRRRARPRHFRDVIRALALTAPTHRKDRS